MSAEVAESKQQLTAENEILRQRVAELEAWQEQRKLVEEKLVQAHEQLKATLNALPDLLFIVDRQGCILDYRAPQPELLYTGPQHFLNRRFSDILPAEVAVIIMEGIEKAMADGHCTGSVYSLETPAGVGWFELSIARQGEPQKADARLVVLIRDISERKEANLAREALITELAAKNLELEQFAYTVSHDLKSPLITIKGFLTFVERAIQSGELGQATQDLARIQNAADKMVILLDGLLELSRIGAIIRAPEPASLNQLVEETINLVAGRLHERGVQLSIMPGMPAVMGDRSRLRQVIQNLLENAVKFMGDQPDPRITVGARRDGQTVTCFVKDNGIGVAPRYAEQIFGLFEQLGRDGEGSGIGLALVKRIVEVHGGRTWVESQGAGQGSTFYFCLPAVPEHQPDRSSL